MKVVLAEKPSVARELASYLKTNARKDGYFEGGEHQVTWALGHLVCLKEPSCVSQHSGVSCASSRALDVDGGREERGLRLGADLVSISPT